MSDALPSSSSSSSTLSPSSHTSPRASLSLKAQEVLYGKHKDKLVDRLGLNNSREYQQIQAAVDQGKEEEGGMNTPPSPSSVDPTSLSQPPPSHFSPSSVHHAISHKAQDLLFGGGKHHADHTHNKLHDMLGLTPQQLTDVQSHIPHPLPHPHEEKTEGEQQHDQHEQPQAVVAGKHTRRMSIANKAMDLLYGGHKSGNKLSDTLGLSEKEMDRVMEQEKKMQHHTTTTTSPPPAISQTTPVPPSTSSPSSLSSSLPSALPSHQRRQSISKKAADLLYGSSKSSSKVEDRLGVREKELDTFARVPKAYQLMGLCDQKEAGQGWGKRESRKAEWGGGKESLQLPTREQSVRGSSPMSSSDRIVSLSQLPQSPMSSSSLRALTSPPLVNTYLRTSSASSTLSALTSSRSSCTSPLPTITASPDPSPRGARRKLILQPLGVAPRLPGLVMEREELRSTKHGAKDERSMRIKNKMRMVGTVSTWQKVAAQANRSPQSSRPRPRVPMSTVVTQASPTVALQLGVTGRAISAMTPRIVVPLVPTSTAIRPAPVAKARPLNPVKLNGRAMTGAEGWKKVGAMMGAMSQAKTDGLIVSDVEITSP